MQNQIKSRIKKTATIVFLPLLLLSTFVVMVYHWGVFPPPPVPTNVNAEAGVWIPKSKWGIHQLIVTGSAYERGVQMGHWTAPLLKKQEAALVQRLRQIIPSDVALQAFILGVILWFQGIDAYFESWMTEEMWGVAQYAPVEYDFLVDGFSRQVAYHGLHEVGQMAVDGGFDSMACTVIAAPFKNHWILARNFDFEGGRIFDEEKIMKWVFPDQGHAYLSVIWAGMVGAVTGVNDQGLYLSINAAGSSDFRRLGTPSTLVLAKVLQFAGSAAEAIEILQREQMFITDIFVLLDSKTNRLYRIEKSAKKMVVLEQTQPTVVTNHLIGPIWAEDKTNFHRRESLTSVYRETRGQALLQNLADKKISSSRDMEREILSMARDKGESDGHPLHLGNRRAIDALIATHSVVFNSEEQVLFVSQGPALAGPFIGFDLRTSFSSRRPTVVRQLPRDEGVSDKTFYDLKVADEALAQAQKKIQAGQCMQAELYLQKAAQFFPEQSTYYEVLGDWQECRGDLANAKVAWKKSLTLSPAYLKTERRLQKKVE